MPIKNYAVLKGFPVKVLDGDEGSPHYQIHLVNQAKENYRVAINVKSLSTIPDTFYYVDEDFRQDAYQEKLLALPVGATLLESKPDSLAIDYVRSRLFNLAKMRRISQDIPQKLSQSFDDHIKEAMNHHDCLIYAFGQLWLDPHPDPYFGFLPGQGIHDIHMNQGNSGRWRKDNGLWQDGALFAHYPHKNRWVAYFIAFASQTFHTDDQGNPQASAPVLGDQ